LELTIDEFYKLGNIMNSINILFILYQNKNEKKYIIKILDLINKELSQVLVEGDNRNEVIKYVKEIKEKIKEFDEQRKELDTFILLSKLIDFFNLYNQKEYKKSIDYIHKLDLLPINSMNDIENYVERFKNNEEIIQFKFNEIIYSYMDSLYNLFKLEKNNNNYNEVAKIKNWENVIFNFSGHLQNQLSSYTFSKLLKFDSLMR
jgi:hypothetical protein